VGRRRMMAQGRGTGSGSVRKVLSTTEAPCRPAAACHDSLPRSLGVSRCTSTLSISMRDPSDGADSVNPHPAVVQAAGVSRRQHNHALAQFAD
jgi:hypothetical protein